MLKKSFHLVIKHKIQSFNKIIKVDSDKSISIRSLLIGAISQNISHIKNILESEDVMSTVNCLRKLGVKIIKKRGSLYVHGKGLGSLYAKKNTVLNFGNSGTLARLMIGILSTTPNIKLSLTGDNSLKKRSMKKLIFLMSQFGASFKPSKKFYFPVKIISSKMPIGINYKAGVSAQLKSAVILAGLNSFGKTKIFEHKKSRNHTEKMLRQNNQTLKIDKKKNIIEVVGKKNLKPININVFGDPSSAAFFCALTILKKNSSLKILNVGLNQTRTGFYNLLKIHGANIRFINLRKNNNELYGDIFVKYGKLRPIISSKKYYVNSTDEYPILFIIAALTKGTSIFKGIKDLANKESNRIAEIQKILKQIGIKTKSSEDELKIFGKDSIEIRKKGILVQNLGDHRICMSSFVLAILTGVVTKIKNFETVNTSSPSFLKIMRSLGAKFEIQK